ncbi:MAG: sodium/glutamate symporter [Proteobacteria bacterium]|nr:sodium/glutamate symporter [Pseudomonadota bacterium]
MVEDFLAYTLGIVVYFLGMKVNDHVPILQEYNIPEPVTGGILASLFCLGWYLGTGVEIVFDLQTRDLFLVYFFTAIGVNARLKDLASGGKPLAILLGITVCYILFQDTIGLAAARLIGVEDAIGLLVGSASLIGGHGTAIAWAPEIAANHGVPNALEIGIASATLGLVIACLMGGPIAKFLLARHRLYGSFESRLTVGIPHKVEDTERITHVNILGALLLIHIAMIIGYVISESIAAAGFKLPLFVPCMLVAILLSNLGPAVLPNIRWPAKSRALAVITDFSLSIFIAMSLMSMQLWDIADLAGPLLVLLGVQAVATALFIIFVFFRLMGGDYQAAVLSAGFAGFTLGATPTAIANMTAVTKSHGPAPMAFIILPLVGAFFVDIVNAFVIQFFLGL